MSSRLLLAVVVAVVSVVAGSHQVGAQIGGSGTATIRVVDDVSGALVPNACLTILAEGGLWGFPSTEGGSYEWEAEPGSYYINAHSCQGEQERQIPRTWHDGSWWQLDPARQKVAPVEIVSGPNSTVTIRVAWADVSLRLTAGDSPSCRSSLFFADDLGMSWLLAERRLQHDGQPQTSTMTVPPGRYQIRTVCGEETRFGPNKTPFLDNAELIELGHRETVDIEYAAHEFDPIANPVGVQTFAHFAEADAGIVYCAETVRSDGRILARLQGVVNNGQGVIAGPRAGRHKVRIFDCVGEGFEDVWYPNASSSQGAEPVHIRMVESTAETTIHLLPRPELFCDGIRATIIGTDGRDRLYGTDGDDVIVALGGNDIVRGGDGQDTICGGDGRDRLYGGRHADRVFGDGQVDFLRGDAGADELFGGRGRDRLVGGNGDDLLLGNGGTADRLDGRGGDDRCVDPSPNTIRLECESTRRST